MIAGHRKDIHTMMNENNYLLQEICESIDLETHSQYLDILNTIKDDTERIILVQIDGEDAKDPIVNTAKEMMILEKQEIVCEWFGTITLGREAVQYTFLKSQEFFDYLSSFEAFFIVLSENPYSVNTTDFGFDDIAFLDKNGDLLFYTTTHEGYAYLNKKYFNQEK